MQKQWLICPWCAEATAYRDAERLICKRKKKRQLKWENKNPNSRCVVHTAYKWIQQVIVLPPKVTCSSFWYCICLKKQINKSEVTQGRNGKNVSWCCKWQIVTLLFVSSKTQLTRMWVSHINGKLLESPWVSVCGGTVACLHPGLNGYHNQSSCLNLFHQQVFDILSEDTSSRPAGACWIMVFLTAVL